MLAASFRKSSLDELIEVDPIERSFIHFWMQESQYNQMSEIGRMLGVMFSAAEVRSWKKEGGSGEGFDDEDTVLVPLAFMLRPEAREGVQKMVGASGLSLPKGYRKGAHEVVVDLGQVTPKEFMDWVETHRVVPPKRG